jgi:hypothetical protein
MYNVQEIFVVFPLKIQNVLGIYEFVAMSYQLGTQFEEIWN